MKIKYKNIIYILFLILSLIGTTTLVVQAGNGLDTSLDELSEKRITEAMNKCSKNENTATACMEQWEKKNGDFGIGVTPIGNEVVDEYTGNQSMITINATRNVSCGTNNETVQLKMSKGDGQTKTIRLKKEELEGGKITVVSVKDYLKNLFLKSKKEGDTSIVNFLQNQVIADIASASGFNVSVISSLGYTQGNSISVDGENGKDGQTQRIAIYRANSTLTNTTGPVLFTRTAPNNPNDKFFYAYYLNYSNPNPNAFEANAVNSNGGSGGEGASLTAGLNDHGHLYNEQDSLWSPCVASLACQFCKKLNPSSAKCTNEPPKQAAKGTTVPRIKIGNEQTGFKGPCEENSILPAPLNNYNCARNSATPATQDQKQAFNYKFQWQMPIASEFLTYGEAGEPGEYVTKKTKLNGKVKIIAGKGGNWDSYNSFNTSGKNGNNGSNTTVSGENISISANGGAGGKGNQRTKRYNLCQKDLEEEFKDGKDKSCRDRKVSEEIPVTLQKASTFESIRTITGLSALTQKGSAAGSGGIGSSSKSSDNFVCGTRKVKNLTAQAGKVTEFLTKTTSGCNHKREYEYDESFFNQHKARSGAVIITW